MLSLRLVVFDPKRCRKRPKSCLSSNTRHVPTVRGVIAGTLKKKLASVQSEKVVSRGRVYRIGALRLFRSGDHVANSFLPMRFSSTHSFEPMFCPMRHSTKLGSLITKSRRPHGLSDTGSIITPYFATMP